MGKNHQADLFQSTIPAPIQNLSDQQRLDWLRLTRSRGIGPVTFRDLINYFGSAGQAIEQLNGRQFNKRRFQIASEQEALDELEKVDKFGAHLVALNEPGYPRWLQSVDGAPPLLYVKGNLALTHQPALAIVGSRNASAAGLKFTSQLSQEIGSAGLVITSGLARGIDTSAHQASLQTGTIAVLGGGIDHIYPAQNEALYHQIGQNGLLISERTMGFRPQAKDFPRRNRLISGISLGSLVVEAAIRSGSLITARFAGEQGRHVFAVPGHPLDPRAAGTNKLIQDGAQLICKTQDILEALKTQIDNDNLANTSNQPTKNSRTEQPQNNLGFYETNENAKDLRLNLLDLLGPTPIERDSLVRLLKCPANELQILLLELDLEGRLEHHGQQKVSLK